MSRTVTGWPVSSPNHNAFPQILFQEDGPIDWSHGLTKREYFAVQAMNAYIIADGHVSSAIGVSMDATRQAANIAVDYADALIKRLNEQ